MSKPFFITTPIYYVNARPHVGHAYTQIAADTLARFMRRRGRQVYFLTGTDEHAAKVARAAEAAGKSPRAYCDELVADFQATWQALGITYDDFIRTTEPRQHHVVQQILLRLWDSGHLELGTYNGWYSVPDETFFRDEDTVERDGAHYIAHPTEDQSTAPLEWVEETTHYFKLSRFSAALLEYYEAHPEVLQPAVRRNETLAFLRSGLRDVSVTRDQEWGIPVPEGIPHYEHHVAYVWFDALINYLTAPGYLSLDPERAAFFDSVWPPDLQLMSKDIFTRFHTTIWPGMLLALGIPLSQRFFAHGFWMVDGRKISKRDPATIVDPVQWSRRIAELAGCDAAIGVDALRYYMLREVTFGADGNFSRPGCLARYNSDLANGLGNLVQRTLSMLHQYFEGTVPFGTSAGQARSLVEPAHQQVTLAYEALDFPGALQAVWEVIGTGNRLIEETKPWVLWKSDQRDQVADLLTDLLGMVQWCAVAISPVMPTAGTRLLELLNLPGDLAWDAALEPLAGRAGHRCQPPHPLFPRIPKLEQWNEQNLVPSRDTNMEVNQAIPATPDRPVETIPTPQSVSVPPPAPASKPVIQYDDFAKVELRAARVLTAERVPKADKLLKLQVDLGTEQRQILAGIAQQYTPEQLVGRTVIVVANLAPRTMRGLESQGMLLAASPDAEAPPAGLLTVDQDVIPGSIVR